jgi:YrbI family 3-deoxy-D-manno-octulosonate 8-phosphate phosphatase
MMDLSNIKLIVYDFDGVMTDNKVYVDQKGNETVKVNRSDGLGVAEIKKLGIHQIIISTEKNLVVSNRAKKIGINCLQDIGNKKKALEDNCKKYNIDVDQVIYVGNDINDKEAMNISGITICPADAHESIKSISNHVFKKRGGDGIVRELYDLICASQSQKK